MLRKKISALVAVAAFAAAIAAPTAAQAALTADLSQNIAAGTQSVDFVDNSDATIASPAVAFGGVNFSFACQDGSATLGTSTQKIQVKNPNQEGIKIDLNAATPGTDVWSDGGTESYAYNDATSDGSTAGCANGQLAVSGGTFTKTAGAGTPTYTTPGGAFTGTSSVTLLNNTGTVEYNADLTNYTLTQKIPAEQVPGDYSLSMVVSYLAQ